MTPVFAALVHEFPHPSAPSERLILVPVVAGTWEDPLKAAISFSGGSHHVLYLPLLGDKSVTALCDQVLSGAYQEWRTSYELRYAISLMAGHPRALEHLLIAYPKERPFDTWRHDEAFVWVLNRLLEQSPVSVTVNLLALASGFLCLPGNMYKPDFWERLGQMAAGGYLVALTVSPVRPKKVCLRYAISFKSTC